MVKSFTTVKAFTLPRSVGAVAKLVNACPLQQPRAFTTTAIDASVGTFAKFENCDAGRRLDYEVALSYFYDLQIIVSGSLSLSIISEFKISFKKVTFS